jgi:hypothetical protein
MRPAVAELTSDPVALLHHSHLLDRHCFKWKRASMAAALTLV